MLSVLKQIRKGRFTVALAALMAILLYMAILFIMAVVSGFFAGV
jgi:hypothetical protein